MQDSAETATGVYQQLGVGRVINGISWVTSLGGSVMPDAVVEAMVGASHMHVKLDELNAKAGEEIARLTGAEAGLVTAGASAGMLLQAAAVIAGGDPGKVRSLPDTTGMKNEIVIHRAHRVGEDRNYLTAGAKFVEIGNSAMAHEWELEAAITDNTAAVAYVFGPPQRGAVSLSRTVEIAHARGVPVIVDAAAMLPPPENLRRYVDMGADMVTFSGGKGVRGPQSSGILCGTRDLIDAAYQSSSPNEWGVARAAKVCKEEIAGLVVALRLMSDMDYDAAVADWRSQCQHIVNALRGIAGVRANITEAAPEKDEAGSSYPHAVIMFEASCKGPDEAQVKQALEAGDPPIYIGSAGPYGGLDVAPVGLLEGDAGIVADRLHSVLTGAAG